MKTKIRCECGKKFQIESVQETTYGAMRDRILAIDRLVAFNPSPRLRPGDPGHTPTYDRIREMMDRLAKYITPTETKTVVERLAEDVDKAATDAEFAKIASPHSIEGILARVPEWMAPAIRDNKVIIRKLAGIDYESWKNDVTSSLNKLDLEIERFGFDSDGSNFGIVREMVPF